MSEIAVEAKATIEELETFLLSSSEAADFDVLVHADDADDADDVDRRSADRVACDETHVELEGLDGECIADWARVVNASPGGMCVEVFRSVDQGTTLTIWFTTPEGARRHTLGVVMHGSRKGRGHYLGIQFVDGCDF